MTRDEYLEQKQSGGLVDDAGQQEEVAEEVEGNQEEEHIDGHEETPSDVEEDDLPPLSDKEKTAFQKRLEREQTKIREKLEAEVKQQYEQQYSRHKQVVDMLGGDPDLIERRIRENQMVQEAQRMADANGWDDEQTKYYIDQQKQQQELKELRVQMQINKLRDNPDYVGIASMERDILAKIDRTNGTLTVEEAYWALGGSKRAEQIKLEAQVREQAKRSTKARTVLTDSPTSSTGEKPLPPEIMKEAERMGVSAAEARRLMNSEPAKDLDDWRAKRQKAK